MSITAIVAAVVTSIIGILYALVKVKSAQSDRDKVLAKAAREEAESAAKIIESDRILDEAVHRVRLAQKNAQKAAQERIDRGERNDFDKTDF